MDFNFDSLREKASAFRNKFRGGGATATADAVEGAKGVVGRVGSNLKKVSGPAGTVVAAGMEGKDIYDVSQDPSALPVDTADQGLRSTYKVMGVGGGAKLGGLAKVPGSSLVGMFAGGEIGDIVGRGAVALRRQGPMEPDEANRFVNMPKDVRESYASGADFNEWKNLNKKATEANAAAQNTPAREGDVMGPDRSSGFSPNVNRVGNRLNTMGGYVESSDKEGMARVEAGMRGIQPKDGQSYVSNNFMTVPAYKTPQSLIDAREQRAAREEAFQRRNREYLDTPKTPTPTGDKETDAFNLSVYDKQMSLHQTQLNNESDEALGDTRLTRAGLGGLRGKAGGKSSNPAKDELDMALKLDDRDRDVAKEQLEQKNDLRATKEDLLASAFAIDGKKDPASVQRAYNLVQPLLKDKGLDLDKLSPEQTREALTMLAPIIKLNRNRNRVSSNLSGSEGIGASSLRDARNYYIGKGPGVMDAVTRDDVGLGDILPWNKTRGSQAIRDGKGNLIGLGRDMFKGDDDMMDEDVIRQFYDENGNLRTPPKVN
jgi:hypothetical protein